MRPVDKWKTNSRHTLPDGSTVVVQKEYNKYRDALPMLCGNLGTYCSYCENSMHEKAALQVEHVEPKSRKGSLEKRWINFLIACSPCNGHKSYKRVILKDIHMPHRNNTYKSLVYDELGGVHVNPTIPDKSKLNAGKLIKLLDLNNPSKQSMRQDTWKIAERKLDQYNRKVLDIEDLMELIKARGGWSIWFTVFKDHKEVRERLIKDFPGTAEKCFDEDNHYEPLDRNPGKTDPV